MSTRNTKQRAVRQEALREQLSAQGHVQHVVDILDKLGNEAADLDTQMVQRYKIVIDSKLKLIGKYLPDLKSTEVTGEGGGPVETKMSPAEAREYLRQHGFDPDTVEP